MKTSTGIFKKVVKKASWAAVVAFLLLTAGSWNAGAQDRSLRIGEGAYAYDFQVFFRVNCTILERDYMENARTFAKLDSVLAVQSTASVDSVFLVAYASPEGGYKHNLRLAEHRAMSMGNYLVAAHPALDGKVRLDFAVQPWPKTPGELARLRYAAFRLVFPYDITIANPLIDDFQIDESWYELPEPLPSDGITVGLDELWADIPEYKTSYKQTIAAVKTNLLYDALISPNVEVEVPIADRWSVMVEDVFPWWETSNKYCIQHWEMGLEGRYWFNPWDVRGTEKLRGFFAGLYGMSAKYDFQWDRSLNYQGEYWSAGVSAGWATPLGKNKWGNLELSLGYGYRSNQYRGYVPADDYSKLYRKPYDVHKATGFPYWPTKAKVSLVVPINVTRTNKGGSK